MFLFFNDYLAQNLKYPQQYIQNQGFGPKLKLSPLRLSVYTIDGPEKGIHSMVQEHVARPC